MSRINTIGVTLELDRRRRAGRRCCSRRPSAAPTPCCTRPAPRPGGYLAAFIVSALMAAYVMVGFDSAGELSEETKDPRRTAPHGDRRARCASPGVGGALLLLAGIMAAPSLTDGELAAGGLPYVITSQLGDTAAKILLADVAIAVCICTLSIQTAAMRMMYSMSRDRVLPFSGAIAQGLPADGHARSLSAVIIGVRDDRPAARQRRRAPSIFLNLTSVCIVMLYLAYLMVTVPLLVAAAARRTGRGRRRRASRASRSAASGCR